MANRAASNLASRRSFTCCGHRFRIGTDNLLDLCLDVVTWSVEKLVLLLGPILICFASAIISGLTWTFFTILLPMIKHKHENNPWIIAGHIAMVIFLLVEICFNYFMCVTTRNKGPNYDRVVRELALATNFDYPETPQQVESFRRDFEAKMSIRIQRRHQRSREEEERARLIPVTASLDTEGDVKNRKTSSSSPKILSTHKKPSVQQVRDWMVMAPDEWGYCTKSNQPKPPRSHYDHVSKTLVLCLDHYCPWMFNASKCILSGWNKQNHGEKSFHSLVASLFDLYLMQNSWVLQLPILLQFFVVCSASNGVWGDDILPTLYEFYRDTVQGTSTRIPKDRCMEAHTPHGTHQLGTNAYLSLLHAVPGSRFGSGVSRWVPLVSMLDRTNDD